MGNSKGTPRRYTLFHKFPSNEEAVTFDEALANALNLLDPTLSNSEAFFRIFATGVYQVLATQNSDDPVIQRSVQIYEALEAIRRRQADFEMLIRLYESMGLDEFTEFCIQSRIDYEKFYHEYLKYHEQNAGSWSEKAASWLRVYLRQNGSTATADIKQAAIEDGLIDGTSEDTIRRDWSKLCVVAHRQGCTGTAYGKWEWASSPSPWDA